MTLAQTALDAVTVGRWQFGVTTVYHFVLVPLTIGLSLLVAIMQTAWHRTGKEYWLQATRFFGKLLLINFALGVATGIVQEFQFGMNWSEYSRFVGDIFGAPLALEALIAFFLESTFLGLWIFGWDKLPKKIHLACIYAAAIGTMLSSVFILAANSWMQHPVGAEMIDGRPRMTDIGAVLMNPPAWVTFTHVITSAIQVAGGFLVGIAWYKLWRRRKDGIDKVVDGKVVVGESDKGARDKTDYQVWLKSLRLGAVVGLLAFAGVGASGHLQAQMMIHEQPLKMAAAEAACHDGTSFSVLTVGELGAQSCDKITPIIEVPGVLSFLAHDNFDTPVKGIQTLLPEYEAKFGTNLPNNPLYGERAGQKIDYLPSLEVSYWGFRGMIGLGAVVLPLYLYALWVTRKKGVGTVPESKLLKNVAVWSILAPFFAISLGWIFTEMGRQPFVVAPNLQGDPSIHLFTAAAISPGVSGEEILFSLLTLGLLYGVLMVVEVYLLIKYVKAGVVAAMPELVQPHHEDESNDKSKRDVLEFAY